jgi:hypothetical protein
MGPRITLEQKRSKVTAGKHCSATKIWARISATVNQEHKSATTTYVMWREESVLNAGVLQTVHLLNLVFIHGVKYEEALIVSI